MRHPSPAPADLGEAIAKAVASLPAASNRHLVALAGAPGAGKSTVAKATRQALGARGIAAGILPMDGFHYDNAILGDRGLLARKGAPETFDVDGFRAMLERLATQDSVAVPAFDRALDKAIAAHTMIGPEQRIVIVEGNYLLLKEPGWEDCARHWALSVFLDVPLETLEHRLIERWREHGLSPAAAKRRAMENDIPNAHRVLEHSQLADLRLGARAEQMDPRHDLGSPAAR